MCNQFKTSYRESVATSLIQLRNNHTLSQSEMADTLGISRRQYQRYENQEADLPYETVIRIKEVFGIDINTFYITKRLRLDPKESIEIYIRQCERLLRKIHENAQKL